MLYNSDIGFNVLVYMCVVSCFPFIVNCDRRPAAIFSLPGLYHISVLDSSNINLYIKTLLVLNMLHVFFYGHCLF